MLYRHKQDNNYLVNTISKNKAVILKPSYWQNAYKIGEEFTIDYEHWIPVGFNEYLKLL